MILSNFTIFCTLQCDENWTVFLIWIFLLMVNKIGDTRIFWHCFLSFILYLTMSHSHTISKKTSLVRV